MMSDWQPIETAPKDGTLILVYTGLSHRICRWYVPSAGLRRGMGCWSPAHGTNQIHTTHWMPLPPPPGADQTAKVERVTAAIGKCLYPYENESAVDEIAKAAIEAMKEPSP